MSQALGRKEMLIILIIFIILIICVP